MKVLGQSKRGRVEKLPRWMADDDPQPWWYVPKPRLWWSLHFAPRELWVGVRFVRPDVAWKHALDVHVAVPMLMLTLSPRWAGRRP